MSKEKVEYKTMWCKYQFSSEELRDIAERLAIKTQELDTAENEKKAVVAQFKERVEKINMEVKEAARNYKDGFVMKDIECYIERDFDLGVVRYVRTDNGEIAQTSKMTMAERQMTIDQAEQDAKKQAEDEMSDEEFRRRLDGLLLAGGA